jgi:hypothetical protein
MKGEARRMDKERSLVPITRSSGMGMLCFAILRTWQCQLEAPASSAFLEKRELRQKGY